MATDPSKALQSLDGAAKTLSSARAASLLGEWRLTPATLMAHLDSSWIPAKWLQYLSLRIAQCIAQGRSGLLISAPPRHGKSKLSTIATPLWVMENFPHKQVIVATYGEELSTDFTREVRDLIQHNQHELRVRLRQDARRVTNLLTTKGGGLKAVGLQGTITGRGADVLVIDDYIKNYKEAISPTYLEDIWNWWLTVARTRLEPGAVVIILATRWVANDLHGRLMKQQAQTGRKFFDYVELPALAIDKTDPIGRAPGEVLFPERYDTESILDIQTELGSRWFNAMFQQRPLEDGSRALDPAWFKPITVSEFERRYDAMLKDEKLGELTWMRAWDLASTKEAGDYTSGSLCLWNKATGEFYLRNIARGQWSSHTVEKSFKDLAVEEERNFKRHGVHYKLGMEREPGASGVYTINHFRKILKDKETGVVEAKLFDAVAGTAKLLNAQPLIAAAEAGKVFVVADYDERGITGWAKDFYSELESFPEGENDDQVDSTAIAYKLLTGKTFIKPTFGRKKQGEAADSNAVRKPTLSNEQMKHAKVRVTFGRRLTKT